MPVLPSDFLVSAGARERWQRWKLDLDNMERDAPSKSRKQSNQVVLPTFQQYGEVRPSMIPGPASNPLSPRVPSHLVNMGASLRALTQSASDASPSSQPREGPVYPPGGPPVYSPPPGSGTSPFSSTTYNSSPYDSAIDSQLESPLKRPRIYHAFSRHDGPDGAEIDVDSANMTTSSPVSNKEDQIVDTVGAIAVDCFGNIAAGSSSGGIGMKHKGRTGPAALVGIGTAVIPVDLEDPERTAVATVTSGTGEHMATTMAAATCSERIYSRVRRKRGGGLEHATEEEAIQTMIENEFMGHPGVKNSTNNGAIGIMSVKKTVDGVFLYFAHNTDSFALASMHSEEKKPVSVMSRSTGGGAVAQGGRVARYRRR